MRTEIRSLQRRLGMTMLYVTHDQTEAMTMADQVILLRDGRVEQKGSAADLYLRPATSFVARFIGTPPMNLITLDPTMTAVLARMPGAAALPSAWRGAAQIGVRPETLRLADAGVPATVAAVEYLGADSIVLCEVAGQRIALRVSGASPVTIGDAVHLGWRAEDTHLYDGGGQRVAVPQLDRAA
jgi:sn-glycerol 3-phosphate transport system ATP-binding protein